MKIKASAFTPKRLAIALIAVPMALGALYYSLIASDRYTSESIVAVKSAVVSPGPGGTISLGSGTGLLSWEDTLYLLNYVHSGSLARELDSQLKLREHYEQPRADLFYRLWPGTSVEWWVSYYRSRVELEFSDVNGLLTIRTQGFDAETARTLNRAILDHSERFVNAFSHRVAAEQMKFSQAELDAAAQRLHEAKGKLVAFQSANKVLDPAAQTAAASALTNELQATVVRQEAELKGMLAYMQPTAPQVVTLRDQIAANRAQLEAEKQRTTNPRGDRLGAVNTEYQQLLLASAIAEDGYKSASAALEAARIEAARKIKSLVIVEPPTMAETAEYPRRLYNLLTLLALSVITYAVVRLVAATIQEHQD